ncbi:MAG: hypothetical protein ACYTE3_30710 [Planctomycetota bacterium]|jgi:hypothetical protein
MTARKSTFVLLLTITGACLIIHGCCSEKENTAVNIRPPQNRALQVRDVPHRTRVSRPYGKLRVPAEIFVDLVRPQRAGDPAGIIVTASSAVAAGSGVITLRLPEIGTEPDRTEILWAGAPSDLIAEVKQYALPALPLGRYHFVGILEFTPDSESAILSSNVSFRQIERLELYAELEQRVLTSLSPGLATADPDAMARYRELIKATNPGLIKSRIAELRAADPEVARRIMELNSVRAETEPAPDATDRNAEAPRVFERPVPIPEGLGQ